jgi:hypothetical protein
MPPFGPRSDNHQLKNQAWDVSAIIPYANKAAADNTNHQHQEKPANHLEPILPLYLGHLKHRNSVENDSAPYPHTGLQHPTYYLLNRHQ